ncbi:MAG: hypothetical protein NDI62_02040 [Burkholderiales bacterium]|nr:hypothetical protein [Burkholderiales bacterium]
MKNETRQCQNCKKDFIIEQEDFKFYEKIKVPPPTFCPECRMIRRMAFRDYRVLYKRISDKTGKTIFSIVPQESPFKVWERDIWWSDELNSLDYGREYDFNKNFFIQLKELFLDVPIPSQTSWDMVNSDYCSGAHDLKNCYLVFVAAISEDSMYSAEINRTKNSIDVTRIESSELCYQSFALTKCYRTLFSSHCENCMDVWFSRDLIGCNSCFGCTNLRNKQYFVFNKQYSKGEYEKFIRDFNLGSYEALEKTKRKTDIILNKNIRKFLEGRYNNNVSGEYINNSKNVHQSYYVIGGEDSKYIQVFFTRNFKDCYDCTLWGENSELCYECSSVGSDCFNNKFNYRCSKGCQNCEYSFSCTGCTNIFGCSGLRNKQYCILNKQYTKEAYEELLPKIKQHMNDLPYVDKRGVIYKYGEFLPSDLSPFCYNESLAQDYFPLMKGEILEKGYKWREEEKRNYLIDIKQEDIADDILSIDSSIIGKVIECLHHSKNNHFESNCDGSCTEAFKITETELSFYKRMNIPIPRLCPNCRHFERIKMRNGIKLYKRKCMKEGCDNEFETSYAPERKEIVYCERCYQQEVY